MLIFALTALVLPEPTDARDGTPDLRCGSYCLYVALKALSVTDVDFATFDSSMGEPSRLGFSLLDLATSAQSHGAKCLTVQTDLDSMARIREPFACIAFLKSHHFVCVYSLSHQTVRIIDPPDEYDMDRAQFEAIWSGNALLISRSTLSLAGSWRIWLRRCVVSGAIAAMIVVAIVVVRQRRTRHR